jgi:hypothetical protein
MKASFTARPCARLWINAWLAAAALCLPLACAAGERELYTLYVELAEPYETSRATLQKMLKAEGYEAYTESDREVSLALTEPELRKLFSARVARRTLEKSATRGTASQPVLQGARIPERFRKLIRRVYLDPQRG